MSDSYLIEPSIFYQKSFEAYVISYEKNLDVHYFDKYRKALENYDVYLKDLNHLSTGEGLPKDVIQTTTFWLIDHEEVVGVVRIRRREDGSSGHIGYDVSPDYRQRGYGYRILQLALVKAKEIGFSEVVLTCASDNEASRKIIEKCQAKLVGTVFDEDENVFLLKYVVNFDLLDQLNSNEVS